MSDFGGYSTPLGMLEKAVGEADIGRHIAKEFLLSV